MHLLPILVAGMISGTAPASGAEVETAQHDSPLATAAQNLERSARVPDRDKKGRKKSTAKKSSSAGKSKGKSRKKEKKMEIQAPEWTYGDGPFSHFLWLARQFPDFERFRASADGITVSIVAHRKKALLFLDSCTAAKKKTGWQISKCNAVKLKDKDFLGKLVKAGTDTRADPDSLGKLRKFMKDIRKTAKVKDLEPLLMEAGVANRQGYRLLDDVEADEKACGTRSYYRALGTVPIPTYIGANVVVVDLSYKVEKKGSYKVHASLAKTDKGWRIGGLRVHCY